MSDKITSHTNSLSYASNTDMQTKKFKLFTFFIMLYMSIMICNAILTNRYISVGPGGFVLGGSFTSPIFFILGDIIAELFGYRLAKHIIFCGFICQTIFSIICEIVIRTPYPEVFAHHSDYYTVFSGILHINMSTFIAYMIAGLVNAKVITKWKILVNGRHFWLRSLGASTLAEALYSAIAIMLMQINAIPFENIINIIILSYTIKVLYSVVLALPTNLLVNYIKKTHALV